MKYLFKILLKSLFLFAAVKFGRMSKKQREKVEDEVRYHREINSQQHNSATLGITPATAATPATQPDSSVFESPQPSSTEHVYGG